jgi:RNA polymerase sigma-70 factor (ECF subfamily)
VARPSRSIAKARHFPFTVQILYAAAPASQPASVPDGKNPRYHTAVDSVQREVLEREIAELCRSGNLERATTIAIEGFGPELLGFVLALLRNEDDAQDAFSQLCEDIWRGLGEFEHRSSFRTWAYTLARHAVHRLRRTDGRYRKRVIPADSGLVSRLEQHVRTTTLPHLRSQNKSRLTELRTALPEEEQVLLILRVDRDLGWNDIADVLAEEPLDDDGRARESTRLRKRFQLVKDKLKEKAKSEGLLTDE